MLKKSLSGSSFKNPKCKEQEKFKAEAYLVIREGLNFLWRRSNREFFNGLIIVSPTPEFAKKEGTWPKSTPYLG
jgi:hypothetical protein